MHIILSEICRKSDNTTRYELRFGEAKSFDQLVMETARRYEPLGFSMEVLGRTQTAGRPDHLASMVQESYQGVEGIGRLSKDDEFEKLLVGDHEAVLIIKGEKKEQYVEEIKKELGIQDL